MQCNDRHLTWDRTFQLPFESGWSIFHKLKALNNLRDHEVTQLIAREPVPFRKGRLRNCADSSWIDFDRFSQLVGCPANELKNGFWDQLGITVLRGSEYELRHCPICWAMRRYHCVLFDLTWLTHCPWHDVEIGLPRNICLSSPRNVEAQGEQPPLSIDEILALPKIERDEQCLIIGHIIEYVDWWRKVQAAIPHADELLRHLVSTLHSNAESDRIMAWECGLAKACSPLLYGSWILSGVPSVSCRHISVEDAGRDGYTNGMNTIRDGAGHVYRAIRRHIYRRYLRQHRSCLAKLSQLSREDCLSLIKESVCSTCLAYVAWRMSVERARVMKGLFGKRKKDYEIRMVDLPELGASDNLSRFHYTYLQYFSIQAKLMEEGAPQRLDIEMEEASPAPHFVYARRIGEAEDAPLKRVYCLYPAADGAAEPAAKCGAQWKVLPMHLQQALQQHEWITSSGPNRNTLFRLFSSEPSVVKGKSARMAL